MRPDTLDDSPPKRRWQTTSSTLTVWAVLVLIGVFGALGYRLVESERGRGLRAWEIRLGVVADARADAVNAWIERQLDVVGKLAENTALQIYMTQLTRARDQGGATPEQAAQAGYLRNLLIVTAERAGFANPPAPQVGANVPRRRVAGLAVLDAAGRVLVATPDMPALDGRLGEILARGAPDARAALDIFAGPGGVPSMAFYAPVFGVQAGRGDSRLGAIVGVKAIDHELYPLLARPTVAEKTTETLLVRQVGPLLEYLSPLADGTEPLTRRITLDQPGFAEAFALANPGAFALMRDYREAEVLVTGRAVAGLPWALVHKVDRDEALAESDARWHRAVAIYVLAALALAAAFAAIWRHGASRRAETAAARLEALARRFEAQSRLLKAVTDNQPVAVLIVDENERIRFANQRAADQIETAPPDLLGKPLAAALGAAEAKRHRARLRAALAHSTGETAIDRREDGRVIQTNYVPVANLPGEPHGVLIVEEDITGPVTEREQRMRALNHLVETLVAVVDRRDPYAAHHSARVVEVARSIAEEMALPPAQVETVGIAGRLLNLGKILVPAQILTRGGDLTPDEHRAVRDSLQATADMLDGVEFDGPVVETLRQAQERWDGSGPHGLRGEDILLSARILAVANIFVAMVSPRAHRPGLGFDAAVQHLLDNSERWFDRRVVAALLHILENRGGRALWDRFEQAAA